jgi:hypothetical protein
MKINKAHRLCDPYIGCTDVEGLLNEAFIPWLCPCGWRSDPGLETINQMVEHYQPLFKAGLINLTHRVVLGSKYIDKPREAMRKIFIAGKERTDKNGEPTLPGIQDREVS